MKETFSEMMTEGEERGDKKMGEGESDFGSGSMCAETVSSSLVSDGTRSHV